MKWTPRKIRALMAHAGYERNIDLATAAGISESTVSRVLCGTTARISPMTGRQLDRVGQEAGFLAPPPATA